MKILKALGLTILGLWALGTVGVLVAMWMYRDIPAEVLEARYTTEASRFLNVDGVRIHYRDEGTGPVVVLVHANFASLIGWDPWVEALKDKYRVIRFDMTSHGLTGPDPKDDYTLPRTIDLTERFMDALELDDITIAGTSLGGTVALHYASRHPDRVNRLILLSPGSLEGREQMERRGAPPDAARILEYILPRALPEYMLRSSYGDESKLDDETVDRWHDLWLREGQRAAQLKRLGAYDSSELEAVTEKIRMPVLLLWGEENPRAKVEQAFEFEELLHNSESIELIIYPGVGHMAVQEAGGLIVKDVRAWLDGNLEAKERSPAKEPESAAAASN